VRKSERERRGEEREKEVEDGLNRSVKIDVATSACGYV
jgi:hypothetical protein